MREALAGMTPSCMGDNALGIALDAVANKTPDQPNVISGTDVFVLTGCRMSASGMGEGIEVVVRDGTKAAKVTAESGTGQRIEARLAQMIGQGNPLTDDEAYTFEFNMVDADGKPVTVSCVARWQAT